MRDSERHIDCRELNYQTKGANRIPKKMQGNQAKTSFHRKWSGISFSKQLARIPHCHMHRNDIPDWFGYRLNFYLYKHLKTSIFMLFRICKCPHCASNHCFCPKPSQLIFPSICWIKLKKYKRIWAILENSNTIQRIFESWVCFIQMIHLLEPDDSSSSTRWFISFNQVIHPHQPDETFFNQGFVNPECVPRMLALL